MVVALYFRSARPCWLFRWGCSWEIDSARLWMQVHSPGAWGVAASFAGAPGDAPDRSRQPRPRGGRWGRRRLLVPVITDRPAPLPPDARPGRGIADPRVSRGMTRTSTSTRKLLPLIPLAVPVDRLGLGFSGAFSRRGDPNGVDGPSHEGGCCAGSIVELLGGGPEPCHRPASQRLLCFPPRRILGIVTGLSLMLMSFGPGVLFPLWRRRFRELRRAQDPEPEGRPPAATSSCFSTQRSAKLEQLRRGPAGSSFSFNLAW